MKALFALCLLLPVGCFAEDWNQHFATSGTPELHISSGNVPLTVHAGSNDGVEVQLKTKGISIGPSDVHVESKQEGNRLELRVVVPESHRSWHDQWIKLEVRVPRNVQAFIKTENAPVELRDLHGTAHLNMGNGPLDIQGFDGTLDSQNNNGPVSVHGRFDGLELRSGNGPLDLTADSNSKITSGWHVETGNGPVAIKLPQDVHADLSLHTGNGPLSFDLAAEKHVVDRHELHAKLNGGGPELSISTGHGPVSIGKS